MANKLCLIILHLNWQLLFNFFRAAAKVGSGISYNGWILCGASVTVLGCIEQTFTLRPFTVYATLFKSRWLKDGLQFRKHFLPVRWDKLHEQTNTHKPTYSTPSGHVGQLQAEIRKEKKEARGRRQTEGIIVHTHSCGLPYSTNTSPNTWLHCSTRIVCALHQVHTYLKCLTPATYFFFVPDKKMLKVQAAGCNSKHLELKNPAAGHTTQVAGQN